ncbi:DUF58 domain-containing protein [soil metagenome]
MAATGLGMVFAGSLFGAQPLGQLGVALLVLALVGVAVVRLGRHDVEITRQLSPERARPSQPVTVSIKVSNKGTGSAPLLLVEDKVPSGLSGSARFALRGIEAQGMREAAITLTASRRGNYEIGPMEISIVDPFGLAQLRSTALDKSRFLVHPRIEPLALPRDLGDRRSMSMSTLRQPTGARGEDFYTLREYVEGDDLRKIHWPSTAKRGRFMIRQEETPWQTRATIVLDDRARAHDGFGDLSSFERAVEAAASLVDLYHRSGYGYRLTAAHAPGLPSGKRSEHWSRCLDLLATIGTGHDTGEDDALVARLMEIEAGASAEASLVVVGGTLSARDALAVTRCRRRFREVTVVVFPSHRFSSQTTKSRWDGEKRLNEAVRLLTRSGVRAVAVGPEDPLGAAWAGLSPVRQQEATWGRRPELV